jgi:hypothetical protein
MNNVGNKMLWIWIALMVIFGALAFRSQGATDDDECYAETNAVQVIRIPQDCFTLPASGSNFYHFTITNAGNYRFVIDSARVFQVLHNFPFSIGVPPLRQGETHDFYLPCNYQPYTLTFVDITVHYIGVQHIPAGAFDVYTSGAISTNTEWTKIQSFTNHIENALFFAPFNRTEAQRYYQLRPK